VFSYRVERIDSAGARAELTTKPLVISLGLDEKTPRFLDATPPVEQEVTYLVRSADLFGRPSDPQKVTIFSPDLKALVPPPGLAVSADKGRIVLKWNPPLSARTMRIIVEQSNRLDGVYQTLTPEGVAAGENRFLDGNVVGGLTYYYRLRSVGPRGDFGRPGEPVSVQAVSTARPAAVRGLKADVGTTRIRLTWEPVRQDLAGYLVERRVGLADFERLNESLVQETRFDDPLRAGVSGDLFYRVRAVTFDNLMGEASPSVKVSIPDISPPPAPTIASSRVEGKKVILHIVSSAPVEKTSEFLVLRSGSEKEEGVVLGRPIAAAPGDWSDLFVQQGEAYWYRAIALDSHGRRSEPSRAVSVFVPVSELPTPPPPILMLQKKPFLGVKVSFVRPPGNLLVAVERRSGAANIWSLLLESQSGTEAWDTNPPNDGEVSYRIVYHTPTGTQSQPSPPAALKR
ncbi:MAG: fibronectin type III domain-containing protein, partial [Candidatus Aminicenantales bacterium]